LEWLRQRKQKKMTEERNISYPVVIMLRELKTNEPADYQITELIITLMSAV
jgi:hypothetical protein